jgi:hypothetical protein
MGCGAGAGGKWAIRGCDLHKVEKSLYFNEKQNSKLTRYIILAEVARGAASAKIMVAFLSKC